MATPECLFEKDSDGMATPECVLERRTQSTIKLNKYYLLGSDVLTFAKYK